MLDLPISKKSIIELKEIIEKNIIEPTKEKKENQIKELQGFLKQKLTFGQWCILTESVMGLMNEFMKISEDSES